MILINGVWCIYIFRLNMKDMLSLETQMMQWKRVCRFVSDSKIDINAPPKNRKWRLLSYRSATLYWEGWGYKAGVLKGDFEKPTVDWLALSSWLCWRVQARHSCVRRILSVSTGWLVGRMKFSSFQRRWCMPAVCAISKTLLNID